MILKLKLVDYLGIQVDKPWYNVLLFYLLLSYDVASGSEITLCIKIDKPLVVYIFSGNIMTSITTLRN